MGEVLPEGYAGSSITTCRAFLPFKVNMKTKMKKQSRIGSNIHRISISSKDGRDWFSRGILQALAISSICIDWSHRVVMLEIAYDDQISSGATVGVLQCGKEMGILPYILKT